MAKITPFTSLTYLLIALMQLINIRMFSQPNAEVAVIQKYVVGYKDVTRMKFINDSILYKEGWHTLAQPKFWQQIMKLSPDSAIISIATNRKILNKINLKNWNQLTELNRNLYKDSLKRFYNIDDSLAILITGGKNDFYEFKKVMPTINRSIDVFKQNNVDPWYAQAILLIESPGKTKTKSGVGANGPFQLMQSVARNQGLIVNRHVDERTDIEKSAMGASRLLKRICIPYVCAMLDSAHLQYNQTDLWFRLLVLHAYHAGAGNLAGVIRKINPSAGGMPLIQDVWQTTYRGFKNASQNYSQLALAAFLNFDELVMQSKDSVYLIEGDRMLYAYNECKYTPTDRCNYLGTCISQYENDLIAGVIPFDYFITKVKTVKTELSGLAPLQYAYKDDYLNDIGFQLLKAKKTEMAYKVFKLNQTHYPDSWNVYHGLGETYRMMGRREEAIAQYRKSLKLNPEASESLRAIAILKGN
ncbi:MAG: transglycosylase SLT domain-containing protein [Bacteroidia bacterium]